MLLYTTIILLVFNARTYQATEQTCEDVSAGEIRMQNKSTRFIVEMKNTSEDLMFDFRIAYKWILQSPEGLLYDGLLYKHVDRSERFVGDGEFSEPFVAPVFPGMLGDIETLFYAFSDFEPTSCDTESGKSLWAVAQNGTLVECAMPCSGYFPSVCTSMEVCYRRNNEDFLPLPKGTDSLKVEAKFGHKYEMTILVYRHWQVLAEFVIEIPVIFCREELTINQGVDRQIAEQYCAKTQTFGEEYSTGPPSHMQLHNVTHDLVNNKATVVVRWQDPLDISPGVGSIKRYAIHTKGGDASRLFVDHRHRCYGSFYCVEVRNVEFGKMNSITVSPDLRPDVDCRVSCSIYGYSAIMDYSIPDMNACNGTSRYCDTQATCTDLPSVSGTSANCSCLVGYSGNGINASWPGGTGCEDYDACFTPGSESCARNAKCIDLPPPSMSLLCSCKPNYFGDGYKLGSGCIKLSLLIMISTSVPLTLVLLIVMVLFVRRMKITRRRSKRFSRFLASSSVKYAAPTTKAKFGENVDGQKRKGVFGAEYEIELSRLQLTGILGRGHFGVVHKAVMKMDDKCMDVAVKTTAEPHSEAMEKEFLAEIGLITTIGKHENIMGMLGCCTAADSITYLVTPLMKYGDLKHFLWDAREEEKRKQDPTYILTERSAYDVGEQVASGLEHLSSLRIIHGDIAARNILVDEGLKCKISDFGLANDVYRYGALKGVREKRVPMKWISPERMQAGKVPITWRSDVWSYGILLFETVTLGSSPFLEVLQGELLTTLRSGYRMPRPSFCSIFLYSVMMKCWEWTPSKRPSFRELKATMKEEKSSSRRRACLNLSDALAGRLISNEL